MKKIKAIYTISMLLLFAAGAWAQEAYTLKGKILSTLNEPIEGVIVTLEDGSNAKTTETGVFSFENLKNKPTTITAWYPGYLTVNQQVNDRNEIIIMMISDNQYKYNESVVLPFRGEGGTLNTGYTSAPNIAKKDFVLGRATIDRELAGQVAGLQVKRGSGTPGEGSYYNLRGIRSLTGDNAPLVIINGVPHMPDKNESGIVNGYNRNIFQAYNLQDIQNITVLKGAEAALYGSLGSNGVIMIETDGTAANDLETKVSYYGQFGINWNDKRFPLLAGDNYKSYLMDVGLTSFDMNRFYTNFPFLQNPNDPKYMHTYNNNTDWQDEIYRNAFVTDHIFRVEGGDEIAKYDLSLGYVSEEGHLKSTKSERYHTQLNANVLVSKQVSIAAIVGFAYLSGTHQPQGMLSNLNPMLAAYAQSPLLNPFEKDNTGHQLATYTPYYFGESEGENSDKKTFGVSNPLAIVNTLDARSRQYDLNMQASISYNPIRDLTLTGTFGMYYNYGNERLFIPGVNSKAIMPTVDIYGEADNLIRNGVAETVNTFFNVNGRYSKVFDHVHKLNALAGAQVYMTKNEYDVGEGRNTANDFYQTLESVDVLGRNFSGYLNKWNWMNMYAHADYTYDDMIQAGINLSADGTSSTGTDANRLYVYPSVSLAWLGKGWEPLQNSTLINKLNVRAEYGITGNTRFATTLGQFYYRSVPYGDLSTVARANVPNTGLKPEKNASLNLGLDVNLLQNRLNISFDYYNNQISDMICAQQLSSVYGSAPYYANIGKMENNGVELALQATLIRTRDFEWVVGGNIAHHTNKIKSLGGANQIINQMAGDVQLITKVGETPYQFYGYETLGVFSTQAEANKAHNGTEPLLNSKGVAYQGGDVHFKDQNGDGKIDDKDRVALGSATPDFHGGLNTMLRYRNISLLAEFTFSKGNEAYNGVRRQIESMSTLGNQSEAVLNRWTIDGQQTNTPRAAYGDPSGNADFSDRWIEDASYLRMKNITLSYDFNKTFLNFFRSGTFYVTGENLLTFTKYLGLDPEFSYSYSESVQGLDYAKVAQPKSVRLGINLKF